MKFFLDWRAAGAQFAHDSELFYMEFSQIGQPLELSSHMIPSYFTWNFFLDLRAAGAQFVHDPELLHGIFSYIGEPLELSSYMISNYYMELSQIGEPLELLFLGLLEGGEELVHCLLPLPQLSTQRQKIKEENLMRFTPFLETPLPSTEFVIVKIIHG